MKDTSKRRRSVNMPFGIFCFFLLLNFGTFAQAEDFGIDGGTSPDGKWDVFASTKADGKATPNGDEPIAYLLDNRTKKIIGPLEEVELSGDETTGRGRGEAEAFWSKDSQLLAVNSFDGFSAEFSIIYKIKRGRALPQDVESPWDSPLIDKVITPRSHSRIYFSKWIDSREFELELSNFLPSGGIARYQEVGDKWVVIKFTPEHAE